MRTSGSPGTLTSAHQCPLCCCPLGRRNTGVKSLRWGFKLQGLTGSRSSLATAIMGGAHGICPSLPVVRLFNGIIDKRRRTRLGFHNRRYPVFFVRQSTLMRLKRELWLNMHAMKAIAIIVVLLLGVVNALELLPAASAFQMYLSGGAVALSLVALIAIMVGRGPSRDNRSAGAEAARPMPVTTRANQADAASVR